MQRQLTQSESSALYPPDYNLIHFVEHNRFLGKQAAETGLKRISRTPYLRSLYEWFLDDKIKEIVIQKPAQIGITDWVVDCILWIACNDPSPTAFFLSDQETAKKLMKFRIEPAFRAMGLFRYRSAAQKQDVSKFEINLSNGFYLAVSWGSSISQTASMSFKRVFCDEINKPGYEVIKDEADTLSRIRERMETFGDSKFILLSTPTLDTGSITKEIADCDIQYDYCVQCPHCGTYQPMKFESIVWEGGSSATRKQIEDTVRYQCIHCSELWTEQQRIEAVENGQAMERKESGSMERVGYQLHRLNSLFKGGNMARMVHAFLRAKDEPGKLQNIINSTFGEPWIPRLTPDTGTLRKSLESCRSELLRYVLPFDCVGIVAGVDVQNKGFWYRLRAACKDTSTFGIDEGFCATWEELEHVIFEKKYGGHGVWRCLIDTGGGKEEGSYISRTEETYFWIRRNTGRGVQIFGTKGSSHTMPTKIKVGAPIERAPSGKPIPGGIRIVQINTDKIKDALMYRIEKTRDNPEAPGNWWIHSETENWYYEHMMAEEKRLDRKGIAEWVVVKRDNHILDTEVLCYAACDPEFQGGIRNRPVLGRSKAVAAAKSASGAPEGINPYLRR